MAAAVVERKANASGSAFRSTHASIPSSVLLQGSGRVRARGQSGPGHVRLDNQAPPSRQREMTAEKITGAGKK